MKDIFQKLRDLLGKNDKEHIDDYPTPEFQGYTHHSELRPEAKVRTKSIYPREHAGTARFRFPLIPDERVLRPTDQKVREDKRNTILDTIRDTRESSPSVNNSKRDTRESFTSGNYSNEKTGFRPTEVISPVYGTKRPETQHRVEPGILKAEESAEVFEKITPNRTMDEDSLQSIKQELNVNEPITEVNSPNIVSSKEEMGSTIEKEAISQVQQPQSRPVMNTAKVIAFPVKANSQDEKEEKSAVVEPKEIQTASAVTFQPIILSKPDPVTQASHSLTSAAEASPTHLQPRDNYWFPEIQLLRKEPEIAENDLDFVDRQIEKLTVALENFNVSADVVGVVKGPTVTRYELQPAPGVKVNKFTNLIDDIKLALAAKDIRMEAPIPGRSAIGIEVPNEVSTPVFIRSILETEEFNQHPSPLAVALGRDISGAPVIGDLKRMPHGLIAGSTGSGKSVCINSILVSLLYKAKPSEVRLILIDPKVVELAPYNHIPHLLTPVVTDPKQATAALKWAVEEMEKRYERFAELGVRDIDRYNIVSQQEGREKLPYILIVIDELADLMMVSPHDVEESICRIAQKARACGIHLLVATQRPSVDVITGLIKANIPTRVAFAVSSQADSRTILDMGGAERLLGKGDMLYYPSGLAKPVRLQGNFVSDDEIEMVVEHVKGQQKVQYLIDKEELSRSSSGGGECDDELFSEALLFTIEQGQASSSSLQRRFRIGYNRAARLIDMMEGEGFISGQSGSKPREVLITLEEYQQIF